MEDTKPTLPVGVSVLLTDGCGCVLLGERINTSAAGKLSTPGGRIEPDEDMFACAMREFKEETGAELFRDDLHVTAFREHFRFGQHYFMFYIHAGKYTGAIENREPHKCNGWGWHSIIQVDPERCTEPPEILQLLLAPRVSNRGKLIRDKIPFTVPELRTTHRFRQAIPSEVTEVLVSKLQEEAHEFSLRRNLEELIDVQEVVYAIKQHFRYDPVEFERALHKKGATKGGFDNLTIMEPK